MKRLKTSTWVLIALVVVSVGLGTTLFVLGPEGLPFRAGHAPFWGRGEKLELLEKELGKNIEELSLEELKELLQDRAKGFDYRYFSRGGHPMAGWFGVPFRGGILLFGFVLGGAVILTVALLRRRNKTRMSKGISVLEILEEQYAEGKISEQEFKRKKSILEQEEKEV